jgi:hypothetical protein
MGFKISPRIFGGLGNQLFCYAAARRLAVFNDSELVIDDVSGFLHDHLYQRQYQLDHFNIPCRKATPAERLEPGARTRRFLKRKINGFLPFKFRSYVQQIGMDFDARLLDFKPRSTLYLEGYWQSEGYFKDVEGIIRSDLSIKPPEDKLNQAMAAKIQGDVAVAVHVRFFDAPGEGGVNNASRDYYARAIAFMEAHAPHAHYYVFSDRPEIARACIPLSDERITCVHHNPGDANAYADLWLMTQCKHFIIANSTFSWWGAWLAKYPDRLVIAPGVEIRDGKAWWGFNGLLPDEWIKL